MTTILTDIVREFTPNWFTVIMGTGALALAINQVSPQVTYAHDFGGGLWLLDLVLFVIFAVFYAAHWILFFDHARQIFRDSTASMYLGSIPMALATIINGFLVFGVSLWGTAVIAVASILWWIDVAMSVTCGVLIPFPMFTVQDHRIGMTAVWLLPIVASEVAAASGALLVPFLSASQAFNVLILCYALWAFSVPLALSILVLLVLRLVLFKLPGKEMAASGWLAVGPIGMGALALLLLGGDAPKVLAVAGLPDVGEVAFGVGIIGGAGWWGYGAWWLLLAILQTVHYYRERAPFNVGCWGLIFPLGVYSLATLALARATHIAFFTVVGDILVICLAALWFAVAMLTIDGLWRGYLFLPRAWRRAASVTAVAGCRGVR